MTCPAYINIKAAGGCESQGAGPSAATILTQYALINLGSAL